MSKVKVSELKRHGIEVVAGDLDGKGFAVSETNANWVNIESTHDHHEIKEFAWRPVTGKQPVNDEVVVDLKFKDGNHIHMLAVDCPWDNTYSIDLWRPSMAWLAEQVALPAQLPVCDHNASEPATPEESTSVKTQQVGRIARSEPIFTQEMADAGELPPVGSTVVLIEETGFYNCNVDTVSSYEEGEEVIVVGHISHPSNDGEHLDCIVINASVNSGFVVINPKWVTPLQTERDKAIESIIDVLSRYETDVTELVKNRDTFKGAAQAIYDAGYRKS